MQLSARILGKEYGLTAEEMNKVLLKLGFLKGTPGDYSLTEKALELAKETDSKVVHYNFQDDSHMSMVAEPTSPYGKKN